jgi:hypothetical protein
MNLVGRLLVCVRVLGRECLSEKNNLPAILVFS